MSSQDFAMPDLGEGLTEADLVTWRVQAGDTVALNQTIAEVETAKALVELPSPFAGTVIELLADEGSTVAVGTPIIRIETAEPVLVGYGPASEQPTRRRPDAKPKDRKLARELGVDVSEIVDVSEVRAPVTGVRKATAAAMSHSATIPQVTVFLTVDVTKTVELISRLRESSHYDGVKVTALGVAGRLACLLLPDHPTLNSSWEDDAIVTRSDVHLGIAAATPRGLLVPVVRDAARLRLHELCLEITRVSEVARSGRASPAELRGSTFTITNIGVFGVDAGTPMLNPGEAAILATGQVATRPWVVGDEVVPRWVTTLSLSFDHRLVDGEQGSKFLAALGAALTDPVPLLA